MIKLLKKLKKLLFFDYTVTFSTKEKWCLIGKVWLVNAAIIPLLALVWFFISNTNFSLSDHPSGFILPLNKFYNFFIFSVFESPLLEEATYRIWIWLTVVILAKICINGKNGTSILAWAVIIMPTLMWATESGQHHVSIMAPVFFAGLTWGWLVAKTKSLWPAVVAHGLANCTLYFAIKLALLFNLVAV